MTHQRSKCALYSIEGARPSSPSGIVIECVPQPEYLSCSLQRAQTPSAAELVVGGGAMELPDSKHASAPSDTQLQHKEQAKDAHQDAPIPGEPGLVHQDRGGLASTSQPDEGKPAPRRFVGRRSAAQQQNGNTAIVQGSSAGPKRFIRQQARYKTLPLQRDRAQWHACPFELVLGTYLCGKIIPMKYGSCACSHYHALADAHSLFVHVPGAR